MRHSVGSYEEDNLKAAKAAGDDTGLPESPVYSNFSRHLWRTHARHGLSQSPNRSNENTNGHMPTQDESSSAKGGPSKLGIRGLKMSSIFAMRRANGDWFALDESGSLRLPLFSSQRDGMLARDNHGGMQLFKPVALDARDLKGLVTADGSGEADFWLVDNPFTSLRRGRSIDRAQLSLLVRDAA